MRTTALALASTAVLLACGGGGGGKGGGASGVTGALTYDRVPTTPTAGLAYAQTQRRPIRGAVVHLVDATTLAELATTTSGEDGRYALTPPANAPAQVRVAVLAQTTTPPLTVKDNTDGALWALVSEPFAPGNVTKDLHAPSGWTGTGYDPAHRSAAPFAILDSMYTAAKAFLAVRQVTFPPLALNWSPNNVPQAGDKAAGQIGTSHWDGSELYILGAEDLDTDEYDDHVIVHEWAHYYESSLSRSDSPGGRHGIGDVKDARLSWGEGWGNGMSAVLLAPDTSYRDTSGPRQADTGIDDDLERNVSGTGTTDPTPGFWSEGSIARILVDLADGDGGSAEPFDRVALGLGPIHDVLTGAQKNTPALTTVFSFVAALKAANPSSAAAIDALCEERGIAVSDAFGGGSSQRPGTSTSLYLAAAAPSSGTLPFAGAAANDLSENWYLVVPGTGRAVVVTAATSTGDVAIQAFHRGERVAAADAFTTGTETASFATTAGEQYVVVLTGLPPDGSPPTFQFTADVSVTSP